MRSRLSVALAALLLLAPSARAENTAFPLERLRSTFDGDGLLGVESGRVGPFGLWSVAGVTNYARSPLVLRTADGGRIASLVSGRWGVSVAGSFGLLSWATVGSELPVTLLQTRGDDIDKALYGPPAPLSPGVGDARLALKFALFDRPGGFDLAAVVGGTAPTGGGTSFRGDAAPTLQGELALSRRWERFRFAANLGATVRRQTRLGGQVIGNEGATRVAAAWLATPGARRPVEIMAGVDIATALLQPFSVTSLTPAEARLGANVRVDASWSAFAGLGLGLVTGWGTPDWRLFSGVRYDPAPPPPPPPDADKDGLPDATDACPREPETVNGFQDADGCPDVPPPADTDGDGIVDAQDRCPAERETVNGYLDEDGCPDTDPAVADDDHDGISNLADLCPLEPETANGVRRDEDGCPEAPASAERAAEAQKLAEPPADTDRDGIPDDVDRCPAQPEDVNGIEDQDGCPDPDADGDEILDAQDKCIFEGENVNGWEDADGCPDTVPTALREIAGAIKGIEFDTAKATLRRSSERVLLKALEVLKSSDAAPFEIVIEGHTDDRGKHDENVTLSQARAKTVREWLVEHGIAAEKLRSEGYGPDKPIDTNATDAGRSRNRRVAFRLELPSLPPPPEVP